MFDCIVYVFSIERAKGLVNTFLDFVRNDFHVLLENARHST